MMHILTVGPMTTYTRTVTITQKFDTGMDFICSNSTRTLLGNFDRGH